MSKIWVELTYFSMSSYLSSILEDEEMISSVVSSSGKTAAGSMKSVGASYYSYLTNVEKQLKEEREAR